VDVASLQGGDEPLCSLIMSSFYVIHLVSTLTTHVSTYLTNLTEIFGTVYGI
jgi:hypothetical protein